MDSRIGQILLLAGVVTPGKIEVALIDQQMQPDLRLGEILALRGWVDQETVDYFMEMLPIMIKAESRLRLGEYFVCAGLLSEAHINELLAEQHETTIPLGQLAVRKGYLKQETIDFFCRRLPWAAITSLAISRAAHTMMMASTSRWIANCGKHSFTPRFGQQMSRMCWMMPSSMTVLILTGLAKGCV